jgi:hypothetical protein
MIKYLCQTTDSRRNAVKDHPSLNGLDFLEIEPGETTLTVHLLKPLPVTTAGLAESITISGGERIKDIAVLAVTPDPNPSDPDKSQRLKIEINQTGDFSIYRLSIGGPLVQQFDPLLAAVDFTFRIDCPSDLDCEPVVPQPVPDFSEPEIDYLAKDYASFRRLMLDRLAALIPTWQTPNTADLPLALVELLAYVGDYLSYRQDAVATEAYLDTARRRVSVRRHARLVDYFMHDGANARVWVQIQVNGDEVNIPAHTKLVTQLSDRYQPVIIAENYSVALTQQPEVFETMHEAILCQAHNELTFHTWGAEDCCLPRGATKATLRGKLDHLEAGEVLVFVEQRDPQSGNSSDADPHHRHAVRLTQVHPDGVDPLESVAVTEIEWHPDDALPFPLHISTRAAGEIMVALGNIVLADHGRREQEYLKDPVPAANPALTRVLNGVGNGQEPVQIPTPARYRPRVPAKPLTCAGPYTPVEAKGKKASAGQMMQRALPDNLPVITLADNQGEVWQPQRDLLNSDTGAEDFVVEIEADGSAYLRFGDGQYGRRPAKDTKFRATYRVGNGRQGNVGAETISHIVYEPPAPEESDDMSQPANNAAAKHFEPSQILAISNPLPAQGGVEPERVEAVRRAAPFAFNRQERAVTPADYATMAERHSEVQKAVARLRWTGSWSTIFVTVDRKGHEDVDPDFEQTLLEFLEPYRMAGHDLEIDRPRYVSLYLSMHVCVKAGYARRDVKRELYQVFSNRRLADGRLGFFHPDNFTFGQPVYLSQLYAAAAEVAGVESVQITEFRRQDQSPAETAALDEWRIEFEMGEAEIVRLDNNPNYPERGLFDLSLEGGS